MIGKINKMCISVAILCLCTQIQGMIQKPAAAAAPVGFAGGLPIEAIHDQLSPAQQPPAPLLKSLLSQFWESPVFAGLKASVMAEAAKLDVGKLGGYLEKGAEFVGRPAKWVAKRVEDYIKQNNDVYLQREQQLQDQLNSVDPVERKAAQEEMRIAREKRDLANNKLREAGASAAEKAADIAAKAADTALDIGKAHLMHDLELVRDIAKNREIGKGIAAGATNMVKELWNNPAQKAGIILAIIAGYYAIRESARHISARLEIPELALETSMISYRERAMNWLAGTVPLESSIADVILEPELAERIQVIADTLSITIKNGSYLPNLILYGPPGTGKTMVAQRIARRCGMHYLYTSGTHIEGNTLEGAIKQIQDLFTFAENSDEGVMIIIDEAEVLCGSRSLAMNRSAMSEKTRKLLNLLLTYFGTQSRKIMIVLLTNRFSDLDEAVLSRADQKIKIGVPAAPERRAILEMYVKKYLFEGGHLQPKKSILANWFGSEPEMKKVTVAEGVLTPSELDRLSAKLEGFVGRDIDKLVLQILTTTYATEECLVTQEIVDRVVTMKLREQAVEIENARLK